MTEAEFMRLRVGDKVRRIGKPHPDDAPYFVHDVCRVSDYRPGYRFVMLDRHGCEIVTNTSLPSEKKHPSQWEIVR